MMGLWPKQPEGALIPLAWLEASHRRWSEFIKAGGRIDPKTKLRLGADVAGMGRDLTCFCRRYDMLVDSFSTYSKQEHTATAGRILNEFTQIGDAVIIDAVGEGAGVVSMVREGVHRREHLIVPFKSNFKADGLTDLTGHRKFYSLRDYVFWAIRDALDPEMIPKGGGGLMIPPDIELDQELTETQYEIRSDGRIQIEDKDDLKKRLGRSPDRADALAMTFAPNTTGAVIKLLGNVR